MTDMTNVAWDVFPLDAPVDARVSPNFKLGELTRSETATRQNIDNGFESESHIRAAVYLCRNIIQKVREHYNRSLVPNSVYRGQELERALKNKPADWVSGSQHTKGQACDIEVPGVANFDLATWIRDNMTFDQLILECYNPKKGPNAGWVHVSLLPPGTGDNRGEVLSYITDPSTGRYKYVQGLKNSIA